MNKLDREVIEICKSLSTLLDLANHNLQFLLPSKYQTAFFRTVVLGLQQKRAIANASYTLNEFSKELYASPAQNASLDAIERLRFVNSYPAKLPLLNRLDFSHCEAAVWYMRPLWEYLEIPCGNLSKTSLKPWLFEYHGKQKVFSNEDTVDYLKQKSFHALKKTYSLEMGMRWHSETINQKIHLSKELQRAINKPLGFASYFYRDTVNNKIRVESIINSFKKEEGKLAVRLLSEGASNNEVIQKTGLSKENVRTYKKRAKQKGLFDDS